MALGADARCPLSFAISIVKYHLLDIDFIINRGLVYSLAAGGVVIIYFLAVLAVSSVLADISQTVVSTVSALFVAFLFNPIRNRVRHFVDRKFFRIQYDFREAVKKFFSELEGINNKGLLGEKILSGVTGIIPAEKAAVIHMQKGRPAEVLSSENFSADDLTFCDKILRYDLPGAVADTERTEPGLKDFSKDDSLRGKEISIIIPAAVNDSNLILVLGKKRSGFRFSAEDFDLLQNVMNTAASIFGRINLQEALIRKNLEAEKLKELNRQKSLFVSAVSHDLKTPLTSIRMFSEMIKMDEDAGRDQVNRYAGYIEGESARLTHLIDNVLNFSRIEKGIKEYRFEETDLTRIVQKVICLMEYQARMMKVTVESEIDDAEMPVSADPDALTEAFINLVSNGMKFSGESKRIKITTGEEGNFYTVSFRDWGIGMSAEEQEGLFMPFYRTARAQGMKITGTGLGLYIIKHISDAHGIRIDVTSQPSQGTIFRLSIPKIPRENNSEKNPFD